MDSSSLQIQGLYSLVRLNEIFGFDHASLEDRLAMSAMEVKRLFPGSLCEVLLVGGGKELIPAVSEKTTNDAPPHTSYAADHCRAMTDRTLCVFEYDAPCPNRNRSEGKATTICAPMQAYGELIGVLSVHFCRNDRVAADELKLILAITDLLAAAVHRVRLFNSLVKEKKLLESANVEINNLNATLIVKLEELKNIQEQLLQAQKQEAIGRLAGGIAHDFNNILMAVIGYAGLASSALPEGHIVREYIGKILEAAERASSLTRQILVFSRKQEVDTEVVELSDIVRSFQGMLKTIVTENIGVKYELRDDRCPVEANPHQMEQVIMNLAINARDAMPEGGTIALETGTLRMEGEAAKRAQAERGKYAFIAVSDTGIGMSDEVKQRIFEPFFTTKERTRGTGLGLAVVYGIVRQHGGFIDVQSSVGQGATFKVCLPCAAHKKKKSEAACPSSEESRCGTEHILVVEDDEDVRSLVSDILGRAGYRVDVATNGSEALHDVTTGGDSFDMVITDIVMPGMNGADLFEEVRKTFPGMKVLLITGHADMILNKHRILERKVPFLEKPFDGKTLLKEVRAILDSDVQP
jgi:signal transduction histidine kinase/ActR/RegA family two-component response regulator